MEFVAVEKKPRRGHPVWARQQSQYIVSPSEEQADRSGTQFRERFRNLSHCSDGARWSDRNLKDPSLADIEQLGLAERRKAIQVGPRPARTWPKLLKR